MTDSPASLGTEVLQFAAKNPAASPFAARKQSAGNLFTEAHETALIFVEDAESASEQAGAFAAITKFFTALVPAKADAKTEDTTPDKSAETGGEGNAALASIAQGMVALTALLESSVKSLAAADKANAEAIATLKAELETAPDPRRFKARAKVDGTQGTGDFVY